MRTIRLWFEDLASQKEADTVILDSSESHHFIKVLRGKAGEEVELIDGRGCRAKSFCQSIKKKLAYFKLGKIESQINGLNLTVIASPPKGKRLPYMLEKLQEVGVSNWTPLETKFSVRDKISSHQTEKLGERLKEACKQAGSAWRLNIKNSITFTEVFSLTNLVCLDIGGQKWVAPELLPNQYNLLIGPEAGWSDEEREGLIEASVPRIGLSNYHLRMETAALIGAARLLESNLITE